MNRPAQDQSLPELIGSLASTIPSLVRDEIELVRSQFAFALRRVQAASALLVGATALAMGAVLLMVAAAVSGLTVYLIQLQLSPAGAVAIASVVVALTSGLLAAALTLAAREQLRSAGAAVERGIDAVTGDADQEHAK